MMDDSEILVEHFNAGVAAQRVGDFAGAIQEYSAIIREDGQSKIAARAYSNRAGLYMLMGNPENALDDYVAAVSLNPESYNAHVGKAMAHHLMGDIDSMIASLKDALVIESEHWIVHLGLGIGYKRMGKTELAAMCYARSEELRRKRGGTDDLGRFFEWMN